MTDLEHYIADEIINKHDEGIVLLNEQEILEEIDTEIEYILSDLGLTVNHLSDLPDHKKRHLMYIEILVTGDISEYGIMNKIKEEQSTHKNK